MYASLVSGLNLSHVTGCGDTGDLSVTPLACLLNALTTAGDEFSVDCIVGDSEFDAAKWESLSWRLHNEVDDLLGYLLMQIAISSAETRCRYADVVGRIFDAL